MINFRIKALQEDQFRPLFSLPDDALQNMGIVRMIVDDYPGFPCRVSLEDAAIGEEVLLLNYEHHPVHSPYRASGPVYVRKTAKTATPEINEVPHMLLHRLLSVRAYNKEGILQESSVVEGVTVKEEIIRYFINENISYIHIHNAKPGCYNCVVERA